jgi:polar amino acid transport system permease protein
VITLDFPAVLVDWPMLLQGIGYTVGLTAVATVLGLLIGIMGAWARQRGPAWLGWPVAVYVEGIRNTPFIVQLFFIFFGLPGLGVKLNPELASLIAMVLNLGAYAVEIVRAGLLATPRGQIEAAQALGLRPAQVFRLVVLPPALARVWPATVSQIIIVMLGSAVCGQIATPELSYQANLIQSRNFRAFEAFLVATALYLGLAVALRQLMTWAGPRWLFGRGWQARR